MANRQVKAATHILEEELKPMPIQETDTFVALQLEFLHLQLVSILSGSALKELQARPNLDLKSSIVGLEKSLDMMCEIANKSPSIFL